VADLDFEANLELAESREARLATGLRTAVVRLSRRLRSERQDDSLGLAPLMALVTIIHHDPISPSALAEREGLQPSSLTRIIATLEQRGLITREVHPVDKRQIILHITDSGREKVVDERRRRHAWLVEALSELTPEQLAQLEAAVPLISLLADN
jgi:DNA-binding MarR family transcriptional regulator